MKKNLYYLGGCKDHFPDKDLEAVKNEFVDINSKEISDVIVYIKSSCSYLNMMTQEESQCIDEVVRDKRYIMVNASDYRQARHSDNLLKGMYLKVSDTVDAIIIQCCYLYVDDYKAVWKEELDSNGNPKRSFISKEFKYKSGPHITSSYVDICGQSFKNKTYGDSDSYEVFPVNNSRVLVKYFGGFIHLSNGNKKTESFVKDASFHNFFSNADVVNFINKWQFNSNPDIMAATSMFFDNRGDIDIETDPLPEEAYQSMETFTRNIITSYVKNDVKNDVMLSQLNGLEPYLCADIICLDAVGNTVVERHFLPLVEWMPKKEDCKISFVEVRQCGLGANMEYTSYLFPNRIIHCKNGYGFPVWRSDKTKDVTSVFCFSLADAAIEKAKNEKDVNMVDAHFKRRYGFSVLALTKVMATLVKYPLFEKAYNLKKDASYKKFVIRSFLPYEDFDDSTMKYAINTMFGDVDETKKGIDAQLGIPKGMFKQAAEDMDFSEIWRIKKIFSSDEAKEYLKRMNRDSWMLLLDMATNKAAEKGRCICSYLIQMFGPGNWESYFNYCNEVSKALDDSEFFNTYSGYLEMCETLIGASLMKLSDVEWHLDPEELNKKLETANIIYYTLYDKKNYKKAVKSFERQQAEWEKLEYSDGEYMVVAPKKPEEIITEGLRLHHCVKDFIEAIVDEVTIIMFVRKCSSPDEPYFTMEIRDDYVRQCHGVCNGLVFEQYEKDKDGNTVNKLEEFIEKYVEEKGLVTYEGYDELLGVDDNFDDFDDDDDYYEEDYDDYEY